MANSNEVSVVRRSNQFANQTTTSSHQRIRPIIALPVRTLPPVTNLDLGSIQVACAIIASGSGMLHRNVLAPLDQYDQNPVWKTDAK